MNAENKTHYPPLHFIRYTRKLFSGRFFFLLLSQAAIFTIYPFLNFNEKAGAFVLELFYMAVLLASLRVVIDDRPSLRRFILIVLLFSGIIRIADAFFVKKYLLVSGLAVDFVFYTTISIVITNYVMKSGQVTSDKIMGSICVYVFIGIIFTQIFTLIEIFIPGSFSTGSPLADGVVNGYDIARSSSFFYLSFITLTTVGFGDVVPLKPPAASFTILEAIIGQVFMTVLVARLVGLHIANYRLTSTHEN